MKRVPLNGVGVYSFASVDDLLNHVDGHKGILIAINAEKILQATPQTRGIINRNIGYCDGVGAVMALKRKGCKDVCKIPGCELWLKIVERFHSTKSFYLIGGKQQVIEGTVAKLRTAFPDIQIAGYRNGYLNSDEEKAALLEDIVDKHPDVVFVAMGSPKQELLMEEMLHRHKAIYQGLGGSFDVYTGCVERAPKWWIDHNMEFLYRLLKQPARIKRQIHLVRFAWLLAVNKL